MLLTEPSFLVFNPVMCKVDARMVEDVEVWVVLELRLSVINRCKGYRNIHTQDRRLNCALLTNLQHEIKEYATFINA